MTTLYDDWISGDCVPAFIPRSYVYRTDEGELAGKAIQFAGEQTSPRNGGFILLSVIGTDSLIRLPYDMTELLKFKRIPSKDLTAEEKAVLNARAEKFNRNLI